MIIFSGTLSCKNQNDNGSVSDTFWYDTEKTPPALDGTGDIFSEKFYLAASSAELHR